MAIDDPDDDALWVLPGPSIDARPDSTNLDDNDALSAADGLGYVRVPETDFQRGALLGDRFKIGSRIGQGGMGTVYEAHDTLRDEAIAIKVLVPGLLQDGEAVRQFQSEAAIAMRLSHPHIVTVYDFHANDGCPAIVMERLCGKTLRDEIRERKSRGVPFEIRDIEQILAPVCQALDYAHTFTVHRDVKPENIWIADDDNVKLMDFGLAMLVQRGAAPLSLHTLSQLRLGSPYYMAPEQLQDARRASAASDQFAVGIIAYELLSGSLPMGLAKPLRELRPDLPYPLTDSVDRALANDPQDRFPSVAAFWEAFQSGIRCRLSWRQHLDTRPVLRRFVLGSTVIGSLALLVGFALSIVDQRATTLLEETSAASSALQSASLEISTVRQLVDNLQRDHLDAEFELKTVQKNAAPGAGDIPAVLQSEIEFARAEKNFAEVDRAWQMLQPRLSHEGTPFTLTHRMSELEDALRSHDFQEFAATRALLDDEMVSEQLIVSRIRALATSQVAAAALLHADANGANNQVAAVKLPSDADLEAILAAALTTEETLTRQGEAQFNQLVAAHQAATERWRALFPQTGPPPIEFLGHPTAKAKAAGDWRSLNRYDRAFALLTEATATLNGWAKEVEDLHARCHDTWAKAQAEGRAFENALGMRFVRIDDKPDSYYWSIWETRIMDFAWFVHSSDWGPEIAGTFWTAPGFPLSPTSPVLGIDPDVAGEFGRWIVGHFRGTGHEGTYGLPTIERFETMLAQEPDWLGSMFQRAIFPDNNRLMNRHWQNEWADPDIAPERHIRPVGLGEPSTQGLYDLFGNTWEWAGDFLESKKEANHHGRDYQFHALYGGGSFGQIGFDGYEPVAGHVFVGRHDALGFRFTIQAPAVERLRQEALKTQESRIASP
ncbi:MAG: bifunctional serine/threonine-protein kinase/formylglycine-generating enzyme family protein [Verrucomicrobiales bacterium]